MKWRRVLIWALPAAIFAFCWAWAAASWGPTGVYVGWIPAVIAGRLAAMVTSLAWGVVMLAVLLSWHLRAAEPGETDQSGLSA
ncbi:hypothetical protein LJR219_001122 [Phenylobacterium sp. LjRoot219]|uniref:hypothetical protein n=1 Tax=Phenylobacterium sp. LjRoot219 TaxID=3342283 RepID=UPI003ECC414B